MSQAAPHDLEAEEALLGAVLLSDIALKKLIIDVGLTGPAFYRKQHEQIWEAMVGLMMKGERVDTLTLRVALEGLGTPIDQTTLDTLTGAVPMASNVLNYADRILKTAEWRRVLEASLMLQEAATSANSELRQQAESKLQHVRRASSDTLSPMGWAEAISQHLEGHEIPAWKTPWPTFNRKMGGGLRAGEVTLLGGWTSMGKSVITDQLLRWCHDHGAKTHLYINEMAPVMRGLRVLSSMSGVEQHKLAQPMNLTTEEIGRAVKSLGNGMPYGVTTVTDWAAADVARDIRFQEWDVCALDLVHRLPFDNERDMAQISTMLNAAAQSSGTHLIGVVHLNEARAIGSTLPQPVSRDIRYSGMLKNDADNVMFIHREEEHPDDGPPERTEDALLYLQKCRNGELGGVKLRFDARRLRFLEVEERPDRL